LGEACCRDAIDTITIKTHRQTEIFPDGYCPPTAPGFSLMPSHVNYEALSAIGMPRPAPLPNIPAAVMATVRSLTQLE
jgi:hypothetical protein